MCSDDVWAEFELDPKCAQAFNWPSVQKYFNKLKDIINKCSIPVENIYNINEKGCQQGNGKKASS